MKRRFWMAVAVTMLVSVGLQIATIGKWSVWHDEGYSAMLAEYPVGELIHRTALDVHPPLYYLLLKLWGSMFGVTDVALRSLSVVFAVTSIVFMALLAKKLFGYRVAYYVLPFLALSPVILRYGQEMRMYTMAMTFVIASVYGFVSYATTKQKKWLGLYVLSAVALLYTHYFISMALLGPWVYLVYVYVSDKKGWKLFFIEQKEWFIAHFCMLVAFLPWLPTVIDQVKSVGRGFWISPVTTSSFFSTLSSFVFFKQEWISWRLSRGSALLAWLVMILTIYGLVSLLKKNNQKQKWTLLIVAMWLVPMLLLFLGSSVIAKHFYFDRYFASLAPFYYLFLALIIAKLISQKKRLGTVVYVAVLGLFVLGVNLATVNGSNYGHEPDDTFTLKHIVVDMNVPNKPGVAIVGSDLGVYFSLRFYLRSSNGPEPYIYTPSEFGKYGNSSIIYNRYDLQIKDLNALSDRSDITEVWYVNGRTQDQSVVPAEWSQQRQIVSGSTKATLYIKQ